MRKDYYRFLPEVFQSLVWKFCWSCQGWHCDCNPNGCECNCPHGVSAPVADIPFAKRINATELYDYARFWKKPTIQHLLDRVKFWNESSGSDTELHHLIKHLLKYQIRFKLSYDPSGVKQLMVTDSANVEEQITVYEEYMNNPKYGERYFPRNRA
jgi:hypothetical protein